MLSRDPDAAAAERPAILVVDDNRDLAENVAELLEGLGADVVLSASGGDALQQVRDRPFDVAIVDVRLPDVSGVDLVSELRSRCPSLFSVILMTGNATLDTAIAAVRHGVFAYVQKPFSPTDMLALVERALEQFRNARERRELARQLARSERLYRGIVDTVDGLIVGVDADDNIQLWNRAAQNTLGWHAAEIQHQPFASLFATQAALEQVRHSLTLARQGQSLPAKDVTVRTRDRRERLIRWHFWRLTSDSPGDDPVLAVGTDVTDRLELERRAAEAEAMASMGQLTTGLAHEIRNPLNAATLQLELIGRTAQRLEDAQKRQRISERVEIVRDELSRLTRLLDDFLDLARPRALQLEPVDLVRLLDEVTRLQQPAAHAGNVQIKRELEPELPPVRGNKALLQQVLVNLMINALEAMRPQGHGVLRLSARRAGISSVEISLLDSGPGIAPEVAGRLFTPFVTSKEAGTGLGLTIVKRIIDRHGGSVLIAPALDGGTVARLTLQTWES